MKRTLLTIFLILSLLLTLAACGGSGDGNGTTAADGGNTTTSASGGDTTPDDGIVVSMNLSDEWNKVTAENSLVQGCVVVRKEFLTAHPDAVARFLKEYKASIEACATDPDTVVTEIRDNGIAAIPKDALLKKALAGSDIRYADGSEMKTAVKNYLEVLASVNIKSIGGALPGDDFYYAPAGNPENADDNPEINIYTLNGSTGFGIAHLMTQSKNGTTAGNYKITVQSDASFVSSALINGDVDIAALPTNAASNLYNVTEGEVLILAQNTGGCLYLLTNNGEKVTDFSDLKGKTVYAPAQNPTFIFTYLCRENGLEIGKDVIIDSTSYAKPADLKDAVAAGLVDIAVLPEPMVTIAIAAAAAAQK